jgi:hypothetical protein
MPEADKFSKIREISQGVPTEMVDELVQWLDQIGSKADKFFEYVNNGYFYQITPSPNAKNGGVQVWCNQDGGCLSGPGLTPNHELWRNGDGTFEIVSGLAYG